MTVSPTASRAGRGVRGRGLVRQLAREMADRAAGGREAGRARAVVDVHVICVHDNPLSGRLDWHS